MESTPRPYRCPVCERLTKMEIEPPRWRCPCCEARLIPADLPRVAEPHASRLPVRPCEQVRPCEAIA